MLVVFKYVCLVRWYHFPATPAFLMFSWKQHVREHGLIVREKHVILGHSFCNNLLKTPSVQGQQDRPSREYEQCCHVVRLGKCTEFNVRPTESVNVVPVRPSTLLAPPHTRRPGSPPLHTCRSPGRLLGLVPGPDARSAITPNWRSYRVSSQKIVLFISFEKWIWLRAANSHTCDGSRRCGSK